MRNFFGVASFAGGQAVGREGKDFSALVAESFSGWVCVGEQGEVGAGADFLFSFRWLLRIHAR